MTLRFPLLRRAIWPIGLAAAAVAGLVAAQPAPPPPVIVPPPEAAPEQAPPITVAPPAPIPVPPITEKEVAPAPPPESAAAAKPAVPTRRTRYDIAVIEALDKVTAESLRFEAQVNRPVRYKSLIFTVRACERAAPEEAIDDSIAYLTIDSQPRAVTGGAPLAARQAYKGWMYASSPGLHPLEHPVYDAWLITCRAAAPVSPAAPAR
ncbi:MAG TPA: DUF2155 domain-containing protein [Phenylobacterium sp.]